MPPCRAAVSALAALAVCVACPSPADASFPASAQRLLVVSESTFGARLEALRPDGREVGSLLLPQGGVNSGTGVSRLGTQLAFTQTIPIELPPNIPPQLRARLAAIPKSTISFQTFFALRPLVGGSSFSVTLVTGRGDPFGGVVGRPAWSADGRSVGYAKPNHGFTHLFVLPIARSGHRQRNSPTSTGTPPRLFRGSSRAAAGSTEIPAGLRAGGASPSSAATERAPTSTRSAPTAQACAI